MKTNATLLVNTLLAVFFISTSQLNSQIYKRAFGFKMGGYSGYLGLCQKEFLNPRISVENSIAISPKKVNRKLSFQTLIQLNHPIGADRKFMIYGGIGPCIILYTNKDLNLITDLRGAENTRSTSTHLAINSFFGAEHQIDNFPLHFSFDMGPSFFVLPKFTFKYMVNISLKYVIRHYGFKPHYNLKRSAYGRKRNWY